MKALGWIAFGLIVLLSLSFVAAEQWGWTEQAFYQQQLSRFGPWAALVVGLLLTMDLFLPIPSSVLMTLSGHLSGFWLGFAANFIGAMSSALLGFYLCRRFGAVAFQRLIGQQASVEVERFFSQLGAWAILLSRPVPMLTEVMSCLAGLSQMRFSVFTVLSALGTAPLSAAYAWLGWHYGLQDLIWWGLLIALLIPALGYGLLVRPWMGRSARQVRTLS